MCSCFILYKWWVRVSSYRWNLHSVKPQFSQEHGPSLWGLHSESSQKFTFYSLYLSYFTFTKAFRTMLSINCKLVHHTLIICCPLFEIWVLHLHRRMLWPKFAFSPCSMSRVSTGQYQESYLNVTGYNAVVLSLFLGHVQSSEKRGGLLKLPVWW